jgi:hypothetical protein
MGGSQSADGAPRPRTSVRNRGGSGMYARGGAAQRTTLTRPYNGATQTGAVLEETERERASLLRTDCSKP